MTAPYTKVRIQDSIRAEHVKFCLNMGGPPSKPKYSYLTDSELVPLGKGEKHPDEGSETVPETDCLQAVGGLLWPESVPKKKKKCDLMYQASLSR